MTRRGNLSSGSTASDVREPSPAKAAQQCLAAQSSGALRSVRCIDEAGVVVLHGKVASFYQKQLAQEIVRRVVGFDMIDNQLEVGPLT